jgi:Cu2+-exporting ATPase
MEKLVKTAPAVIPASGVTVVGGGCCCGAAVVDLGACHAADRTAAARTVTFAVPGVSCGACIRTIEGQLHAVPGVRAARVNLATRRLAVTFDPATLDVDVILGRVRALGFEIAELADDPDERQGARVADHMPRLGVAGFAAANVMLLSVSVWAGHASSDMDHTTRDLFHWLSALIALPAIAYAGQPFFRSALAALSTRRLNMDVPISLGILLAAAMSLWQTARGAEHVYFDAAITLVFFLLVGRTLDERMRARAVGAAHDLMSLRAIRATVLGDDGTTRIVRAQDLVPGMRLLVPAGERIAADGRIVAGVGEVDESLVTGESVPRPVGPGDRVHAGTVNGGGPLTVLTTATAEDTLLAEIARLMLAAEQARGRYVRLADRAARLYAPAVHILGLATLVGWIALGAGVETSLMHAIAVLIITCPCALALAVPAVQVAAVGRLFRTGVIVKAADGLERLAEVDTVVFDKTGTLTRGAPTLAADSAIDDATLAAAAALAVASRHPYARGVVRAAEARGLTIVAGAGVREVPGSGLAITTPDGECRLGSPAWCGADPARETAAIWYRAPGRPPIGFPMVDELRSDAAAVVATLTRAGYGVELLSGDRPDAVAAAAAASGIVAHRARVTPDRKLDRLTALARAGHRVLMVGDGLNDAPALAAAHASLSPATAIDVAQTAADAIFQGERLVAVVEALAVARHARRLALQNFALAIGYNLVFVPIAMAGLVTPLVAAVAMSTSSILVTANALRIRSLPMRLARPPRAIAGPRPPTAPAVVHREVHP